MEGKEKTKDDIKNQIRLSVLLVILILLVIAAAVTAYFWYNNEQKTEKVTTAATACGALITEDGKTSGVGPYQPDVKAKITGNYQKDAEVCQWTLNGSDFLKSKPYGEYCAYYGLKLNTVGEYKVSYKVIGQEDCAGSVALRVTGLTAEEEKIQEAIKKAGQTAEDTKLKEEYEQTKN